LAIKEKILIIVKRSLAKIYI